MNNNKTFEGKVALVTGGTSGIGKATAIEFARAGAKVVLTGRREKEGAQVVAEIKKLGGEAAFVRADIAKDADVKKMVNLPSTNSARSTSPLTTRAWNGQARSIRRLRPNIAAFSISMCGEFSIRCVTKFQ